MEVFVHCFWDSDHEAKYAVMAERLPSVNSMSYQLIGYMSLEDMDTHSKCNKKHRIYAITFMHIEIN